MSGPASPALLNRSGRKHSIPRKSDALESGWDLFYKSGTSASKPKAKPKLVIPKMANAAASKRNLAPVSKDAGTEQK